MMCILIGTAETFFRLKASSPLELVLTGEGSMSHFHNVTEINKFYDASEIVEESFPFVPEYDWCVYRNRTSRLVAYFLSSSQSNRK